MKNHHYTSREIQEKLRLRRLKERKNARIRFWLFMLLFLLVAGGLGWFT